MLEYECSICKMRVKGLTCGKCNATLQHEIINTREGDEVKVCACPKGCGRIKSPMCCRRDMEVIQK